MSDLLLMASSPLRSLLSTPGLVACYLPYLQVAQSLTGQSLLDYSGNANHAQLGSTTGADANDPSWGSNVLTFGGDDYCACSGISETTALTRLIVFRSSATVDATQILLGGCPDQQIPGLYLSSTSVIRIGWLASSNEAYTISSLSPNTWYSVVSVLSQPLVFGVVNGVKSVEHTPAGTFASQGLNFIGKSGYSSAPGYVSDGVLIALVGHINRAVGTGEAMRLERNMRKLLAGQGVTI